jgi:hypothetical protein
MCEQELHPAFNVGQPPFNLSDEFFHSDNP